MKFDNLTLQDYQNERLRRIKQFEECSKRVRNAKENGLWRSTSWGGGFQKYIGEFDSSNRKLKKRDKPPGHVQWNLQANVEFVEPKNEADPIERPKQLTKIKNNEQYKPLNVVRSISDNNYQSSKCHHEDKKRTSSSPLPANLSLPVIDDKQKKLKIEFNKPIEEKKKEKNINVAAPIQRAKPITTAITTTPPIKQNESPSDNIKGLFNATEGQSRNMVKNAVRRISVTSTTPSPTVPSTCQHSILQ
ncbi:unnamed protein product [Onchocerca ochengi]|uniref:Uncharacterized protein n=1 Tax=Onchocerca ochengi TaxID=42157 RepID=A0A182E2W9_ONCOC|nr:unnamed protein product [Onchocerca ochengi]